MNMHRNTLQVTGNRRIFLRKVNRNTFDHWNGTKQGFSHPFSHMLDQLTPFFQLFTRQRIHLDVINGVDKVISGTGSLESTK